jgi:hemerythrin
MALIPWKQEFKLGVASVDYEHEVLIGLLNELIAGLQGEVSKDAVADILGEVHTKIAAHFALEEQIMREAGYDQYDDHKTDHEQLLDDIRDIMDRVEDDDAYQYQTSLAQHLETWFTQHFSTKDARLHKMLG